MGKSLKLSSTYTKSEQISKYLWMRPNVSLMLENKVTNERRKDKCNIRYETGIWGLNINCDLKSEYFLLVA